jgi:hypothetical protein
LDRDAIGKTWWRFARRSAPLFLTLGFLSSMAFCQDKCSCAGEYPVVDAAFKGHGRLSNWNGNPSQRIWIIGTKRMLGIREGTELPENLSKLLGDFDTEVHGDFALCPLTKSKPGVMQIVCVQSANNLRAEKRKNLGSAESSILPIEKLAAYENYTALHIDETWIVSAHSERLDAQNTRSEILAYHFGNNQWKVVFSKAFENAYNARIEIRRDMEYRKNPIVVLRIQYGAAYEELSVYAINSGTIRNIQTLAAGMFEWSYQDKDSRVLLVAVPAHIDEKRIVFSWNGSQFAIIKSDSMIHKEPGR